MVTSVLTLSKLRDDEKEQLGILQNKLRMKLFKLIRKFPSNCSLNYNDKARIEQRRAELENLLKSASANNTLYDYQRLED